MYFCFVKSVKNSILALVMVPLILFSSGGLNIFRHFCHSENHVFYSISSFPSCPEDQYCSHCGHNECDMAVAVENGCENSHTFIHTVSDLSVGGYLKIIPSQTADILRLFKPLIILPTPSIVFSGFLYTDFKSPPLFIPKFLPVLHQQLLLDFA